MALNSPSIRRFNHTIITKQIPRQFAIDNHNQMVAQYLASGGRVDVLPGFTEIAPLPPRKAVEPKPERVKKERVVELLPDSDGFRTIPGYPTYAITSEGVVRSRTTGKILKGREKDQICLSLGELRFYTRRSVLVKMVWGDV